MKTPKGFRLHIGIYGRRNVGKSSLLNALTRQNVAIVSDHPGTTTDPVEKPMELQPIGPVVFIDTAGIDDDGSIGELRIEKTHNCIQRTDVAILVANGDQWGTFESELTDRFRKNDIPFIVVFNKSDSISVTPELLSRLHESGSPTVSTSALSGDGLTELRKQLVAATPDDFMQSPRLISDLVPAGKTAVLVIPIDKEAPKGRLILPQVQTIRELLDNDSISIICKERELRAALENLKTPPALVVTDSQAFLKVAGDVPRSVPMTGFSILFARLKGDLTTLVKNTLAIEDLKPNDKILIAEACTHHPIADDIGRVKIPRWLRQYKGFPLEFTTFQGHDFPDDLASYSLVVHCGGCMNNRREMLSRMMMCSEAGVPITNYGLTIAYTLGIFSRALVPFPAALEVFSDTQG